MFEQSSNKKFKLFTHFRGFAKHFLLYNEKRPLPLSVPDFNAKITYAKCMLYLRFESDYISG